MLNTLLKKEAEKFVAAEVCRVSLFNEFNYERGSSYLAWKFAGEIIVPALALKFDASELTPESSSKLGVGYCLFSRTDQSTFINDRTNYSEKPILNTKNLSAEEIAVWCYFTASRERSIFPPSKRLF